jgi:hypothetical protein
VNTRAPTSTSSPNLGFGWSGTFSATQAEAAALLLICITLAVGAFLSFPLYDDGWLALVLRESGRHSLAQHMGDRPVFGFLLEWLASFGAANRFVFVLLNAVLWLGFAIESGMLFRKLFPEFKAYSIVAACLTLAPIVLQTQLSTALVAIPANFATILGYAAILLLLRHSHEDKPTRPLLLGIAAVLAASGVALSEYGVATNLVGCVILIGVALTFSTRMARRQLFLRAAWLFALTGAVYLLFAKTADFNVRPDVAPAHMLRHEVGKWMEVPFDVIAGAWHAMIGAYAAALGNITLAWDSKSTIVGVLFGFQTAILLCLGVQKRRVEGLAEDRLERFPSRLAVLLPAILVGLLPFSLMGRATTLLAFGSRFRIPIMPVAAATTVCLALYLVRPSFRWIPVAMFGFIIGYASWISTYSAIQQTRAIAAVQGALKPYVAQTDGYTVAVVPFKRFETELTANVTSTWPLELEKRLWVVAEDPARIQFGDRSTCRPSSVLDIQVRGLARVGKLDQLLWVEAPSGKSVLIEPYCHTSN